jgi:hypothetical protein
MVYNYNLQKMKNHARTRSKEVGVEGDVKV